MASITDKFYDLAQKLRKFPHFLGSVQATSGAGAPGADAGPKGSLYLRTDGGASTTLYVREAAGAAVAATGILTLTGNAVAGETVTIGGVTYTFVTGDAGAVLYAVKVGTTASNTLDHLWHAITAGTGAGTEYGTGTPAHPTVTAAAGAGDTIDVTALVAGLAGNSIGTTSAMTAGSWGASALSGGLDDNGAGWAAK